LATLSAKGTRFIVFIFASRAQKRAKHLQRLKRVTHFLMKYIGLTGHCECMTTRDVTNRPSHLLIIYTPQLIPAPDREALRIYFQRKLADLHEIKLPSLLLIIRDGNDLTRMRQQPERVSSARAATIIKVSNEKSVAAAQAEQRLAELRRQMALNRWQRHEEGDHSRPQTWAMTDLGALEPDLHADIADHLMSR
jgi:hypothetical protein